MSNQSESETINQTMPASTPEAVSPDARVRGIIFDCDGVLFDSKEVNRRYYNALRSSLGLPPLSEKELEYAHMQTVAETLEQIIPKERRAELHQIRKELSYHNYIPYLEPSSGLYPLLDTLKKKGIRMAINTNRLDTMERILDHFKLTSYFFPVITSAKVTSPKPDPEGILSILAAWGYAKDEVRYIGDSKVDEITASRAGVPFWAYGNEQLVAHRHLKHFETLTKEVTTW